MTTAKLPFFVVANSFHADEKGISVCVCNWRRRHSCGFRTQQHKKLLAALKTVHFIRHPPLNLKPLLRVWAFESARLIRLAKLIA